MAHFFIVVPQKQTPLYDLAESENREALESFTLYAEGGESDNSGNYYSGYSWYQRAYGLPLNRFVFRAYLRFYLNPVRVLRILKRVPHRALFYSFKAFIKMIFIRLK